MDTLPPHAQEGKIPEKACTFCGQKFPATAKFFYRSGNGLRSECKRCRELCRKAGRNIIKVVPEIPQGCKQCSLCKGIYPATTDFFHRKRSSKDGLRSQCKTCKSKVQKEYMQRAEALEKREAYFDRPEIREREKERRRNYRNHPDRQEQERAKARAYNNRPERREANRAHHKAYYNTPEGREKVFANSRARRARKKSVPGSHSPAQIQAQLKRQKFRCYYAACGHAKFEKVNNRYVYHIDHTYPLDRVAGTGIPANDISYLVLACPSCNLQKGNKFPWEWPEGGRLL